jgi:hypothetical protein
MKQQNLLAKAQRLSKNDMKVIKGGRREICGQITVCRYRHTCFSSQQACWAACDDCVEPGEVPCTLEMPENNC